ncbi:uncharacterized protein LOC131537397 [Onychostoma macrolepis]|uniref:uncharacterized protein LOC131537397 n=1 Tax=Onychostoma macrolepis TaxID=369639 RepID=UPI00272B498E|nr:uncharacterized protein LOC131537397 [Onychostoma macrolepis]
MSDERGKEMNLSEKQSECSDSETVKSDQSKDDAPNFSEETPSPTRRVRSGSRVSVKSDQSKGGGPNLRKRRRSSTESDRSCSPVSKRSKRSKSERSGSPDFSSVSMKSDQSKSEGPNLSEKKPSSTKRVRSGSRVSVKSDQSKDDGPNLRKRKAAPSKCDRSSSPVSKRSNRSKVDRPNIRKKRRSSIKSVRSGSHVSSSVSVKSDQSKDFAPPKFSEKTTSTESKKGQKTTVNIGVEIKRWETLKAQKGLKSDVDLAAFLLNRIQYEKTDVQNFRFKKRKKENLVWIFQDLEKKISNFLMNELDKFKKILKKENTQYFVQDFIQDMCEIKEAALDITLYFLKNMKEDELADTLKDELVFIYQRNLKKNLKNKYERVFEGIAKQGDSRLLNSIYTDLYITQGCSEQVNTEHEVRQIEVTSRRHESQEIHVECNNLFEAPEQEIRTVLTKGVAGIGKSVSVQKFVVDWAEGKENQDISFIFPLPFREMNLKDKEKQSLMSLINQFFPETRGLNLTRDKFKVLFILDGLDECRLPLNFESNETWRDVSSPASLDVLLTNLIKGNLLPSALIWITTRPAAASKIPPDYIDRVTEVRGFNDAQKEEYFKKRFTDENQAKEIIHHVKQSKSLFIMCHIPVFCWISATVLQNILEEKRNNDSKNNQSEGSKTLQESNTEDTPKTLTQMYTYFLRFQIQQSKRKYDGEYRPDVSWDKDAILSLGKLAFHQLEKNNVIFYDTDLESCGIDAHKASVYSGMCTQIFKEETGIILGTMYCFVHMSIQEFIAALYAHLFLDINMKSAFVQDSIEQENKKATMIDLLKTAVDKALESDNGHLDLFLRFLLGLSLESKTLLRGLLTQQDDNDQSKEEIVQYIKQKFEANLSPERSINLFYCLNELNDQTLVKDIQTHLREGSLSSTDLSPAQWSAVAFVLLTSEEEMEEFELQKFKKSDECLIRLSPVIKTSKKALLNDCDLTEKSCSALATVLESDTSLKELNMNNNNLQDSGVKLLCTGLKSKLEILSFSKCEITEESCSDFASVLSSDSSSLKYLDLSSNNLQDSGVKLLSDGLKENRKLEKMRLSDCSITEEGYKALASALRSNPLHLIELDLTGNDPGQSGVKELSDLLQDPNCQLKTLRLNNCELTEKSCSVLATVLSSKTILKEMNLNNSHLLDSGVKEICEGLKNPVCELKILKLSDCSVTEEGYKSLASALRSNPLHLIELDLIGNDPGQSGVKELNDLLKDPNCQLKTLRLLGPAADVACQYVTGIVGKNPLNLRELNLSGHELGDTRVNQLAALLQDKHCKLNTLQLSDCGLTEKSCSALATVLRSNPSLKELDMSNNNLQDSGVKKLQSGLENTNCTLEKLRLSDCSITEEGYKALASALRSNPSHLIELDLTGNDPGQSGVKQLSGLLQSRKYSLKTLRFLSPDANEAYKYLTNVLGENLLLLRDLNLSECELGHSELKKLAAVLQDKHCKLNTLILNNSYITEEDCRILAPALNSNPSNLKELNLSGTKIRDSGLKIFSTLFENEQCGLQKLNFNCIGITEDGCAALTSAFNSNPSNLKELDLSENKLGNSGITEVCTLLENSQCTLQILRLSDCSLTEEGYKALASALRSNPSHLIELDLTGNDPGQSGVKELSDLLQDPNCQLKTLRFLDPAADKACQFVTGVVGKNPLLLSELNLSERELGDTQVNQLTALLQDKHCTLNTLMLNNNSITAEGCAALTSAINSNPSNLKVLDLSGNKLGNSGIEKICHLMKNLHCRLEKLKLSNCSITEEGYKALASALRSNPSHLIELDLTGNDPGQSGVKQLSDLLQDGRCKLKTIRFLSPAAEKACAYLTKVLGKSPLLLKDLDLSGNKLGDLDGKKLSALLMDSHCKLEKIKLNYCELTEKSCSVLATVLSSKTILKEMNLNNSRLLDSGVKEICEGLKNPVCELNILKLNKCELTEESCSALASVLSSDSNSLKDLDLSNNNLHDSGVNLLSDGLKNNCKLEKLRLSDCSITEEGYKALASALRSNPSHLIELDLTGNYPGLSGVKKLSDLLQDGHCTVRFLRSPAAEEACEYLTKVLGKSPLLLKQLDLSGEKLGDLDGEKLSALLMDSHSKVEKIKLNNCELTEKSCSVLAAVLSSKTILKEMNLNNSRLLDSGVKEICEGLKNPVCELKILKLSNCGIAEEGYKALASALRSNPSHLIELDLTGNDPGQSGVKKLSDLLQNPNCQLKTLRLLQSPDADKACKYLAKVLHNKNPLLLSELNLSGHELGDRRVNQIAALLQDKHCTLNTLTLHDCDLTEKSCSALAAVLRSKPSLKELDMSNNNLLDSGVKKLQSGLENTNCTLEKLTLSDCSITEEGYKALASALRSNPSHLIELDLTGNDPGQSGVKELSDLLQDGHSELITIRFLKSPAAEEACEYLTKVLDASPLLLTELDLSGEKLRNLDGEKLSALLMDSHCKVEKIKLNNCELTEKSCSVLAAVLSSKTILKEMNLNNSRLLDSGVKEICEGLKNPVCELKILKLSDCSITEEGYKALASALRSNPSHLTELDLTGNDPGQSGVKELSGLLQSRKYSLKTLRLLSPAADEGCQFVTGVVGKNPLLLSELNLSERELGDTRVNQLTALLQDKHCKLNTLQMRNCDLTQKSCSALAAVLRSNSSLKELDMSNNNLQDSGVKKLQSGLENTNCTLEKLTLSDCSITEEGYKALASALRSNPSHLIELDLTGNDPGQSGVKELCDLLQDQNCQLKTLRLLSPAADEACQFVTGIVGKNPLLLRELNLSGHELGDTQVNQLAALLQDKYCKLNTLQLNNNSITAEGCAALTSAINSNPSNMKVLDLSGNKLGNSGMKKICYLLENPQCRLEKLKLCNCSITEEGYKALASALRSNPSHLIELDLTGNDPGQSGVKELCDLLQDQNCQLKTLRLRSCNMTDEGCSALTSALKSNPSHLRELDLSENQIENTGVNHLCDVLKDSHCKLERLRLRSCNMTDEGCSAVTSALKSNPSHLRELDLSDNKLGDSGVKNLSDLLMNQKCKLETLDLFYCSITEKQSLILTSALKSNPSHLRELDLSENKLGDSGVKNLSDLLMNQKCKLETLDLFYCSITEKQSLILTSALKSNPSHLRELDHSGNQLGDSGVKNLSDLLMNTQCKMEKLHLCRCSITEKQSLILTSALKSNPSHLRELNLSKNQLGNSGVENLGLLLGSKQCHLENLNLSGCSITEKHCLSLTLCLNLSHLRKLDLSGNKIANKGAEVLCGILKDSRCKLEKLSLNDCGITDAACLSESLTGKKALQFLTELNLSQNSIGNSREQLIKVLQNSNCKLRLDSEQMENGRALIGHNLNYFSSWLPW